MSDEQNWGEPIALEAYGRALAERRAALGPLPVPRNGGARRTESERALLAAIDAAASKKGFRW